LSYPASDTPPTARAPGGKAVSRVMNAPSAWLVWSGVLALAVGLPVAAELGAQARGLWWDCTYTAASTMAAILWFAAARANRDNVRMAATVICIAIISWWISELLWLYCEIIGSDAAIFPSPISIGFILFVPLLGIGLVLYIQRSVRRWFSVPLLADLGVITAVLIVVVGFPMTDLLNAAGADLAMRAAGIAYPVVSLLLVVFSFYCLLAFGWGARRWVLLLLLLGALSIVGGDFIYSLGLLDARLAVGWLDPAWFLGFSLIALAAIEHQRSKDSSESLPLEAIERRVRRLRHYMPAIGILIVIAEVIRDSATGGPSLDEAIGLLGPAATLFGASLVTTAVWNRRQMTDLQGRNEATAEALRESEARFGAVLEFSPDPMLVIDQTGRICAAGRGLETVFGLEAGAVVGASIEVLSPHFRAAVTSAEIDRLAAGRKAGHLVSHRFALDAVRRSGATFPLEGIVFPLAGRDTDLFGLVLRDVTEHREVEQTLRTAKETAEIADRSKSEFLANMSHELRTPLNAIIGFAEIIEGQVFGAGDPRYTGYAHDIALSGRHLLSVLKDILDFSRIDARNVGLNETEFELSDMIGRCITMIRLRAQENGVALVVALPEAAPRLYGDEVKLKQVLLNLLSNAVKFTPRGGRVTIGIADRQPGDGLALVVRDTGIGMRPEDVPLALSPFGQIASPFARNHDGVGLGLPLALHLTRLHQGRLEIASRPGEGTTVTLHLPPERIRSSAQPTSAGGAGFSENLLNFNS